jgi:aldehyde dehydrogenase (NAD+)
MNTRQFYINGLWVDPIESTEFHVINPSNERVVATISLGSEDDSNRAIDAASHAFNTWSVSTKNERLDLMASILENYLACRNEITNAISQEMGAPIDLATNMQFDSDTYHLKEFIKAFQDFSFERTLDPDILSDKIILEPIGVCGLITPRSWPISQVVLKIMAGLAAGCTMVFKPSTASPISGMLFANVLHIAGVPDGVFNLINGNGTGVGTALSQHPSVTMISFSGSSQLGIATTNKVADPIKPIQALHSTWRMNEFFEEKSTGGWSIT